ncbi:uncharacterized protein LOC113351901 [Papaver somniferum]|uniref:uncharacterized protein LOC113351901 n=1 Tax=Papaver somniferum TaxID=3469 RepID=UPI000E6F58DD|nr:uncharacterized protein LOC113351901 [Papaver somniferum]
MQILALPKETLDKLDRVQRDFWWKKDDSKKKGGYIKAWNNMYRPKSQGGLGIKNPHKFNIALLTKLSSRVIIEKEQLWVKLLEAKYFDKGNPMEPTRNYELSWIWKSIQKGLNIIKGNYTWQVKNGNQVKIWEDHWIPNEDIVKQPTDIEEPLPQKVNELLNTNGEWNYDLVTSLFTPEIKEKILTIQPREEDSD